jgi:hypothetical protein
LDIANGVSNLVGKGFKVEFDMEAVESIDGHYAAALFGTLTDVCGRASVLKNASLLNAKGCIVRAVNKAIDYRREKSES